MCRGDRRRGGWPRRGAIAALLCALLLLGACDPGDLPDITEASGGPDDASLGAGVPEIPIATVPPDPAAPGTASGADPAAAAPATVPPQAGDTVLVHLEGPLNDRAATDVVIRNEAAAEVDRFRLPGAVGVWAAPGATTALIYTLPGGWARYDAVTDTLSLVTFPSDVPSPTIQAGSGIAGPTALWDPLDTRWMLRMDTGTLTDLDAVAPDGTLEMLSRRGSHALLRRRDSQLVLVESLTGAGRTLPVRSAAISGDGQRLATIRADGLVSVEDLDDETVQALGQAPEDATPVSLPDGRVLLTGASPALLGEEGAQPLTPSIPIRAPLRVSADGSVVLATGSDGLVMVDTVALSASPLPSTNGFAPLMLGPGTLLWAASISPTQPGALVVDPATRAVTTFLPDTPTMRFSSISADGRTTTMVLGESTADRPVEGGTTVRVDADGTVTPLASGMDRAEAYLHPGGELLAIAVVSGPGRDLIITPQDGPELTISTGRNPVWLQRTIP